MTADFDRRVAEGDVARILALIDAPPNRRSSPAPGDPEGFAFWFDGGACMQHTGSEHYRFADGTTAVRAAPIPWLWVTITFPNGESVTITQVRDPATTAAGGPAA